MPYLSWQTPGRMAGSLTASDGQWICVHILYSERHVKQKRCTANTYDDVESSKAYVICICIFLYQLKRSCRCGGVGSLRFKEAAVDSCASTVRPLGSAQ